MRVLMGLAIMAMLPAACIALHPWTGGGAHGGGGDVRAREPAGALMTGAPGLEDGYVRKTALGLTGRFYIRDDLDGGVNEYTSRLTFIRRSPGLRGYAWSGVSDVFGLRMKSLALDRDRLAFELVAVEPGGRVLARRKCAADLSRGFDAIPYRCEFVSGPAHAVGDVQTGVLVRDSGQSIITYERPQTAGACFLGASR